MEPLMIIVVANVVVLVVLVWVVSRKRPTESTQLLQQQLVEVRDRLDDMTRTQAGLPAVLAASREEQTNWLTQQLTAFAGTVSHQIEAGHETVGRRLADTGDLIGDLRERLGRLSASAERMEQLGADVNEVQGMLRVPQLRGAIGELWLEEMLRQMMPPDLFEMQYTFQTGERADAVVRLGDRLLAIDAKFPLDACRRMLEIWRQ